MLTQSKYRFLPVILLVVTCLAGCRQFAIGFEGKTPVVVDTSPGPTTVSEEMPTIVIPTPNKTFEIPVVVTPTESRNPTQSASQYWKIEQDPYGYFRFAAPCFWRIGGMPDGEPSADGFAKFGSVSYGLYNFPEDYASAFPRGQGVFENGGFKVAFELHNTASKGYPANLSPKEFVQRETNTEQAEIMVLKETTVNGLPAVDAHIRNKETDSTWHFYLIQLNETIFLRFFTELSGKVLNTPDVQSLLNSITIDPNANISLPTHIPAAPPTGVTAVCMP